MGEMRRGRAHHELISSMFVWCESTLDTSDVDDDDDVLGLDVFAKDLGVNILTP